MQGPALVAPAGATMVTTVRGITAGQLDAPTPCSEYDVRRLLNHLLYWGPSLVGAGTRAPVAPLAGSEQDVDLTTGDWSASVAAQTDRIRTAWSEPAAWEGTTRMVGPDPLPASMLGGMVVTELVVHAWDLARATDQQPSWPSDLLAFVHDEVEKTAEQGRQIGAYGPTVAVPETAPLLDRILGLTGRDAAWRPG